MEITAVLWLVLLGGYFLNHFVGRKYESENFKSKLTPVSKLINFWIPVVPQWAYLLVDKQMAAITRSAFYQLISQMQPFLDRKDLATMVIVVHTLVTSRLDYWNMLYVACSWKVFWNFIWCRMLYSGCWWEWI